MKTLQITKVRDQLFDLVNAAFYSGQVVQIKKGSRVFARIIPEPNEEFDWEKKLKWLKDFKPFLTDQDVKDMEKTQREFKSRFPDW